jgi:hypothetical protein
MTYTDEELVKMCKEVIRDWRVGAVFSHEPKIARALLERIQAQKTGEYLLVPRTALTEIEKARKGIHDALEQVSDKQSLLWLFAAIQNHTAVLWNIANRRYSSLPNPPETKT